MNRKWSFSDEAYRAFHRWPTLAAFIIVGCLVGWFVSILLPPHFRGITQIYVALNPYRTYSDSNFLALARPKYSNIDDYKDWQMTQLESVIYLDEFINTTIERLRQDNPDWLDYSSADLRNMLETDWRSAGTWSLIANSPDPVIAGEASRAWSTVVVEGVNKAIEASRQTILIDQELQANRNQFEALSLRKNSLNITGEFLKDWQESVSKLSQDQTIERDLRWKLLAHITGSASFTPIWQNILQNQPGEDASLAEYLLWKNQAQQVIEQELDLIEKQLNLLDQEHGNLSEQYRISSEISLGLSPNLEIESVAERPPAIVRNASTFILIGAASGFLLWVFTQFVMITRKQVYQ